MRYFLVGPLLFTSLAVAQQQPPLPVKKITPGKVIVPTDRMRRIWGELISIDPKTRTGIFRNEGNDEVMPFTIMPYAELLHHASFGDVQDYKKGERAIFRLHENEEGQWVWLTYIQDEMNFLNGHKEYYWVDALDPQTGRIEFTQANADKSFIRDKGLFLETNSETRFWKNGQPAKFADIKIGDKLRTKTHGIGKGKVRVCWEVFLDDESLLKFQAEQKAKHQKRMLNDGVPGYLDVKDGKTVEMTIFQEGKEIAGKWKKGQPVQVAHAGLDRKADSPPLAGLVRDSKAQGNLQKLTIDLAQPAGEALKVGEVVRVWGK